MIDLRSMSGWPSIQNSRRARAQGGALLGELDRETHAFGLATTGGMVHHTGVGGSRWGGNPVCLVAAAASRMCRIRQFRPQETCPVEHDLAGKCSCEQQRTRWWTCRRSGKGSHSQRGLS
jgi:hypothetical protein